ncbi:transketolase-like TK C-terminal-containing protein [Legionella sp. 29fVS95]
MLSDCQGLPDAILLATGSEVQLALAAAAQMTALGKKIRVVGAG